MRLNLYVNSYTDRSPERQAEIDQCLRRNIDNPLIARVVLIDETGKPPAHPKVTPVPFKGRPTFDDYFDVIGRHTAPGDVNVITNSDVYFDDSLGRLADLDLMGRLLTLLRYEVLADGSTELCNYHGSAMSNSQDAWIFRGKPRLRTKADFTLGRPGCDCRLARLFWEAGYEVYNPAFDLKSYHLHVTNVRGYDLEKNVTPTPWLFVSPCTLAEIDRPRGVVAFSLFENTPAQTDGALANVKLAGEFYPGWAVRFYADKSIPAALVDELRRSARKSSGCRGRNTHGRGASGGSWWPTTTPPRGGSSATWSRA